eukprot:CAMPEP_0206609488 /NCGR_PEP_ID=MMETSP0325_2-20121206/53821_1 /ASSEMBLY_ACC=CAM_ASM_000347 /TAXON_ID=2866 /ORGANISM="Crypthecodinium cohnii, Strain Seligo" /LENGTH=89 /DNA_ID=CAMNT_0054127793 /DNA_START=1020 /DNA_END=1289 /DNA_ORIENTATION=+
MSFAISIFRSKTFFGKTSFNLVLPGAYQSGPGSASSTTFRLRGDFGLALRATRAAAWALAILRACEYVPTVFRPPIAMKAAPFAMGLTT